MKLTTYLINDEKLKVRSLRIGSALWLHVNGELWVIDAKPRRIGMPSGANAGTVSGEVFSPMPGKILKVNIKKGDLVSTQKTLIVMEAMKMEYNLLAPLDGLIESVACRVGDIVELNQLLVVVKKGE